MDAPGIREELYDFARRMAGEGYFVLLPDMYYRSGRLRFDLATGGDGERARMFAAMQSLTNQLVMDDTKGMLDFLDASPLAAPGPRGCIGRSEEHTSELQSLMRTSYAVFCLKKKKNPINNHLNTRQH